MDVICSPIGIVDNRRPGSGLRRIRQAGFGETVLDFNVFTWEIAIPKRRDEAMAHWREWLEKYVAELDGQGFRKRVAIAPHFTLKQEIPDMEKIKTGLVRDCIRYAGGYGYEYVVVLPFEGDRLAKTMDINREFYLSLVEPAKEAGVTVLLVNTLRDLNGHSLRGFGSEPAMAAGLVDELNEAAGAEVFGFCLDIGACNMVGQNMYDFLTAMGHRIKSLYLYENDGVHNNCILPFLAANGAGSQLDWLNLIRGVRAIGFNGPAIMGCYTTVAALPQSLHPMILAFAHKVARYLEWQAGMEETLAKYPSRVLFGAGNMCRAYMKCYGEKYPPLYTCDNNASVWGNEFCGLTIHNPEDLKSLPMDCAVFICNIYYDEIEQQLLDMGIKNPIERFNDEYMPSFHFARLESDAWKGQVK